jgi:DNA-binding LacI/PurR family transcriptional regulator
MEPKKQHPAFDSARIFLTDGLDKGLWPTGSLLPSVRSLASMAGVSTPVMCSGLRVLKQQGRLSGLPRHRIRVGPGHELPSGDPGKIARWVEKRMRLEQDLLTGSLGISGMLPTIKELMVGYGTSYATVRKILAAMAHEGVIVPRGKSFVLPTTKVGTRRNRVVFITMTGHVSQHSALNQEHNRIVNAFESECVKRSLVLEVLEIDFYDSLAPRSAMLRLTKKSDIEGFFIDTWWYDAPVVRQGYRDILIYLVRFRKPVALLDELGGIALPGPFDRNALFQVYKIEGERSGERISQMLVDLGHRAAAYISLFPDVSWSRERFAGIKRRFSRAGFSQNVYPVYDRSHMAFAQMLTASGIADADVLAFIRTGRTPSQIRDMEEEWLRFKSNEKPPYDGWLKLPGRMRREVSGLAALARNSRQSVLIEKAIQASALAIEEELLPIHLGPCIEQALKHGDARAWVCANDQIAIAVIKALKKRNIRIPGQISVVGFDNVPVAALEQGLTTYDFNAAGFIHRILNFIARPSRPRGPHRHEAIEIEGIIMERATTGVAANRAAAF